MACSLWKSLRSEPTTKEWTVLRLEDKLLCIKTDIIRSCRLLQGNHSCIVRTLSISMTQDFIGIRNTSSGLYRVSHETGTSSATVNTKGRRSQRYVSHGVLMVVSKLLSLSSGTRQYPDLASSSLK